MSYILDALKRADAERNRGAVPGLHARQLPSSGHAAPTHAPHWLWWLMATVVTVGVMAVGWWLWRMPADVTHVPAQAPLVAVPVDVPTPAVAPILAAVPAPVPAPLPTPLPAPAPQKPEPVARTASTLPVPKIAAIPKASAPANTAPPLVTPASAPPPTPAAIPLLSELADATRSQIPALAITGTVYADDPKQRLLLVNNQVLPQGSVVAPDVTLEEIRPRSSVFNFRGTRFRVAH